jgi:hypothetical protein
MFGGYACI